jgi:hypothetical protein
MQKKIHFFVINMNKNAERYENIKKMLDSITNCSYSRIEAINGYYIEHNLECQELLKCRTPLLNTVFKCLTFDQEWIYDGSISTSFPGLNIYGHEGAKGLILSNIKAFNNALLMDFEWYCILEDDAIINQEIFDNLHNYIKNPENINSDIILLDDRHFGWGGTAGLLYNIKIIGRLLNDLHPLSEFSITMEEKYNLATLWDWKLWTYIKNTVNPSINYTTFPCIKSGDFLSTINV